jgi:hypothetical protein
MDDYSEDEAASRERDVTAGIWREPPGTVDSMSIDEFSPRMLVRLREHAAGLLDSGFLLIDERYMLADIVTRCDKLLAMHAAQGGLSRARLSHGGLPQRPGAPGAIGTRGSPLTPQG